MHSGKFIQRFNSNAMNKDVAPAGYRHFSTMAAIFVGTLILSNIAATKLIPVGPFIFSAGVLLFPFTYIFGDCLTEVYGYTRTRQVIWTGFGCSAFMALFFALVVRIPPAKGWPLQEAFAQIFDMVPRLVCASLVAYFAGEFTNSYVMAKMKILTSGRYLWTRTIGSTLAGQGVDTIIFVIVGWSGLLASDVMARKIVSGYVFKVTYEILATPITYLIVGYLKRSEGVDVYDRGTRFNPFTWGAKD